ncbi:hypothetical protein Droror1_Dr00013989 [Drosera rotundifolia]
MSTPSLTATSGDGDGGKSENEPLLAGADSVRDSVARGMRSRSRRGGLASDADGSIPAEKPASTGRIGLGSIVRFFYMEQPT